MIRATRPFSRTKERQRQVFLSASPSSKLTCLHFHSSSMAYHIYINSRSGQQQVPQSRPIICTCHAPRHKSRLPWSRLPTRHARWPKSTAHSTPCRVALLSSASTSSKSKAQRSAATPKRPLQPSNNRSPCSRNPRFSLVSSTSGNLLVGLIW